MKNTPIGWCDHTFNPWIGCTKVSTECKFCYAEALELRFGKDLWGDGKERQRTSVANWRQPVLWNAEATGSRERKRVFCASLADIFDQEVPGSWRHDLFTLIEQTPMLDWLILTKRPQFATAYWCDCAMPKNIWLGVSVGNNQAARERIPSLVQIPFVSVRFISAEPLLERTFLTGLKDIDWVIVGGESGPHHRGMEIDWARDIKAQCDLHHTAFFMKQLGGHPNKRGDMNDFPEDLRVREFPRVTVPTL